MYVFLEMTFLTCTVCVAYVGYLPLENKKRPEFPKKDSIRGYFPL